MISLATLPESCFPESDATNRLASLRAKGIKARIAKPFPLVDVAEFLPSWAEEVRSCTLVRCSHRNAFILNFALQASDPDPEDQEDGEQVNKKKKLRLDMVRWLAAYNCYALAADATGVCSFLSPRWSRNQCFLLHHRSGILQHRWLM